MVLEYVAGSRSRLVRSALGGVIPLFSIAYFGSEWIREKSTSPGIDMLIITVWLLMALVVAYLVAVLIGDSVFPKGWRDVQVLGRRTSDLSDSLEAEDIVRAARGQTLPFAGIWVGTVLALSFLTQASTSGFFDWYSQYGFASSALRGDNQTLKIQVLEEMTRAPDGRLVGYAKMAFGYWDDDDSEVRLAAYWSVGEIGRRMTRSIGLLDAGETGGEWVRDLHAWLMESVAPMAITRFSNAASSAERTPLAYVLGGLQPPEMAALFENYLSSESRDTDTDTVVLLSLAKPARRSEAVPLIRQVLEEASDTDLLILALWAAGEVYGLGTGSANEAPPDPELVRIVKNRLSSYSFEVQCVALDALTRLRTEETNEGLFALFETVSPPSRRCERREQSRRFGKPILVSREEELREKIVKVLASVADGSDAVMAWLEKQSLEPSLASGLRSDMRYILDVLAQRKQDQ